MLHNTALSLRSFQQGMFYLGVIGKPTVIKLLKAGYTLKFLSGSTVNSGDVVQEAVGLTGTCYNVWKENNDMSSIRVKMWRKKLDGVFQASSFTGHDIRI